MTICPLANEGASTMYTGEPIDGLAATVVAHRGAWVGVARCFQDIAQRRTGIQRSASDLTGK